MQTHTSLARTMAHQMLDRSALSKGTFTRLPRHGNAPARTVTMHFKMPPKTSSDTKRSFERLLARQIHRPNKQGHVNVNWTLPGDEADPLPFEVEVTFRVPTFSARFFRGKEKSRFIDRHAWHLVAKAVARELSGPDRKQLGPKLREQFPDQRHPVDRFLRRLGQGVKDKASEMWWELKPVPRDKYRDYR